MAGAGFVNIHTHWPENRSPEVVEIYTINYPLETEYGSSPFSAGLHPWKITPDYADTLRGLTQFNNCKEFVAVGEAGMDKLCKINLNWQETVFRWQTEWSEAISKPLMVHCVRAHAEMLHLRKKTRAMQPWIVHGFASSEQTAGQWAKMDCFISLGPGILNSPPKVLAILDKIGLERIFLETDDSKLSIIEVYAEFARLLQMDIESLRTHIFSNFAAVFPHILSHATEQ